MYTFEQELVLEFLRSPRIFLWGWENPFDLMSVLKDFGHVERSTSGGLWELWIGKVITSDIRNEAMNNTKQD